VALGRTVQQTTPVLPTSPLFVLSQAVEPLAYFQNAALLHHPGLAKVAARKSEAEQLHEGALALRRPQVFGFAQRMIKADNADWAAGVGVRWTLYESLDRGALDMAARKQIEQAEHTDAQARSDIALQVEKNWLTLEQARRQYLASQSSLDLAAEVLRLRQAGLRQGTSTAMDLIDAEVNNLKVQTERSQTAYDYVSALAALLESCGMSDDFAAYMARADVRIR
jgi:outer membrane protein TolC